MYKQNENFNKLHIFKIKTLFNEFIQKYFFTLYSFNL